MYNEHLKLRFIEQYAKTDNVERVCKYTFKITAKYEEELGKDVYAMSEDELKAVVADISGPKRQSQYHRVNIIKAYVRFCKLSNISGVTDGIMNITVNGTDKIRKFMVANPEQFSLALERTFLPVEYDTKDIMLMAYCWLIYSGVDESLAREIKVQDVDLRHSVINHGARSYPIYRQAIPVIERCMTMSLIAKYASSDKDQRAYTERIDGDILVRGMHRVPSTMSFRNDISRKFSNASKTNDSPGCKLSPQRIALSGLYYRTHELEIAGIEPDFSSVSIEYMAGKEYSKNVSEKVMFQHIVRDYEVNYDLWKLTFNYL